MADLLSILGPILSFLLLPYTTVTSGVMSLFPVDPSSITLMGTYNNQANYVCTAHRTITVNWENNQSVLLNVEAYYHFIGPALYVEEGVTVSGEGEAGLLGALGPVFILQVWDYNFLDPDVKFCLSGVYCTETNRIDAAKLRQIVESLAPRLHEKNVSEDYLYLLASPLIFQMYPEKSVNDLLSRAGFQNISCKRSTGLLEPETPKKPAILSVFDVNGLMKNIDLNNVNISEDVLENALAAAAR